MAVQIALAWDEKSEAELVAKGFKKETVYVKYWGDTAALIGQPVTEKMLKQIRAKHHGTITGEEIERGDSEFFRMKPPPLMFVTTSWWGAGVD